MTDQPESGPTSEGEPAAKKGVDRWAWGLGLGLIALCLLCGWGINSRSSGDEEVDMGADAERVCQDFVKKRLKAPATAEFSGLDHRTDGSEYTVTGAVDAQNSFGALLRSDFTCVVRDTGSDWELRSVSGIDG